MSNGIFKTAFALSIVAFFLQLAFYVGIIYVAIHFLRKIW